MMQQMNTKSERDDFFTNILQARRPDTGEPYDERELMGEAILLLFVHTAYIPSSIPPRLMKPVYSVAGSDTTSTALTVIIWHLLANPKTMEKLTAEICEKFDSAEAIKYQALQGLPYLHAVIEEGLRICPPNPGLIPRLVVDRTPGHLAIDGRIFPPGVRNPPDYIYKNRPTPDPRIHYANGQFGLFRLKLEFAISHFIITLCILTIRMPSFRNVGCRTPILSATRVHSLHSPTVLGHVWAESKSLKYLRSSPCFLFWY